MLREGTVAKKDFLAFSRQERTNGNGTASMSDPTTRKRVGGGCWREKKPAIPIQKNVGRVFREKKREKSAIGHQIRSRMKVRKKEIPSPCFRFARESRIKRKQAVFHFTGLYVEKKKAAQDLMPVVAGAEGQGHEKRGAGAHMILSLDLSQRKGEISSTESFSLLSQYANRGSVKTRKKNEEEGDTAT